MGKRGPAPKPTVLEIAQGRPGKRALNKSEPRPTLGIPECPDSLTKSAKAEWNRISPKLDEVGLLTHVDRATLAAYCQCWARWVECEEIITRDGLTMELRDDKGTLKSCRPIPEVGISLKLVDKINRLGSELGLSPSARTRISVAGPANAVDSLEAALA